MRVRDMQTYLAEQGLLCSSDMELLRGMRVGVDAVYWIRALSCLKDPLADATGGPPASLYAVIDAQLRFFEACGIEPVFVFQGMQPRSNVLFSSQLHPQMDKAWKLLARGERAEAIDKFSLATSRVNSDIIWCIFHYLKAERQEILQAPYLATAQLACLAQRNFFGAVLGHPSLMLFGVARIIVSVNFKIREFSWVDKEFLMKIWKINHEQFIQACLFAGTEYCVTFPHLNLKVFQPWPQFNFSTAIDFIRQDDIRRFLPLLPPEMMDNCRKGYCVGMTLIQHPIVLYMDDAGVRPLTPPCASASHATSPPTTSTGAATTNGTGVTASSTSPSSAGRSLVESFDAVASTGAANTARVAANANSPPSTPDDVPVRVPARDVSDSQTGTSGETPKNVSSEPRRADLVADTVPNLEDTVGDSTARGRPPSGGQQELAVTAEKTGSSDRPVDSSGNTTGNTSGVDGDASQTDSRPDHDAQNGARTDDGGTAGAGRVSDSTAPKELPLPYDFHKISGLRLPTAVYFLMGEGILSRKVPSALALGEWLDSSPTVDSAEYGNLLEVLIEYRCRALGLVAEKLNPTFRERVVTFSRYIYFLKKRQPSVVEIGRRLPNVSPRFLWKFSPTDVAAELERQEVRRIDLKFCLKWHANCEKNGKTICRVGGSSSSSEDEDAASSTDFNRLLALVHFMLLEELGFFTKDGGVTLFGAAVAQTSNEFQEYVLFVLELMKFGFLSGDPFEGVPARPLLDKIRIFRRDDLSVSEQTSILLLSRLMSLIPMQLRSDRLWNSDVDCDLAAFHSIVRLLRRTLRQLTETSLCNLLLMDLSKVDIVPKDVMNPLHPKLPCFLPSRNCLGVIVKYFLEYEVPVDTQTTTHPTTTSKIDNNNKYLESPKSHHVSSSDNGTAAANAPQALEKCAMPAAGGATASEGEAVAAARRGSSIAATSAGKDTPSTIPPSSPSRMVQLEDSIRRNFPSAATPIDDLVKGIRFWAEVYRMFDFIGEDVAIRSQMRAANTLLWRRIKEFDLESHNAWIRCRKIGTGGTAATGTGPSGGNAPNATPRTAKGSKDMRSRRAPARRPATTEPTA